MFERFTREARRVVEAAIAEAGSQGSDTVEAEHLLLALARRRHPALSAGGLDAERVAMALADERQASLAAAGVDWDLASRDPATDPRFAASAKLALERSLPIAVSRGDRRLNPDHLLLGVLAAEVGTVPRALALAGVDRSALQAAV